MTRSTLLNQFILVLFILFIILTLTAKLALMSSCERKRVCGWGPIGTVLLLVGFENVMCTSKSRKLKPGCQQSNKRENKTLTLSQLSSFPLACNASRASCSSSDGDCSSMTEKSKTSELKSKSITITCPWEVAIHDGLAIHDDLERCLRQHPYHNQLHYLADVQIIRISK